MGKQLDLFTKETQPEALKKIIEKKTNKVYDNVLKLDKKLSREITKDVVKKLGIKKA